MTKMFFSLMMIFISFYMIFINHPLTMGFFILIQTLLTCILSGIIIKTYWFSYILFLTILGGLLVMFIYVPSIASNEMFSNTIFSKFYMIFSLLIMMNLSIFLMNNLNWLNFINNSDMIIFFNELSFFNDNEIKINLNKLYNNHTFILMMMLIIYLFITLISVVKITNIFYGSLRSSNN